MRRESRSLNASHSPSLSLATASENSRYALHASGPIISQERDRKSFRPALNDRDLNAGGRLIDTDSGNNRFIAKTTAVRKHK